MDNMAHPKIELRPYVKGATKRDEARGLYYDLLITLIFMLCLQNLRQLQSNECRSYLMSEIRLRVLVSLAYARNCPAMRRQTRT